MASENQIKQWLATRKPERPLLVHGAHQSGKKSLIRKVFREKGFVVQEPSPENLDKQADRGILGKHAFIMRMEEVGTKSMPFVKVAPVIYVCTDPYDYGTKADLNARFQMLKMITGRTYVPPSKEREPKPNFWGAMDKIRSRAKLGDKIATCEAVGDFFNELVFMSYLKKDGNVDRVAMAADHLSQGDMMGYSVPNDFKIITKVIYPSNYSLISSKDLVFQQPKLPESQKLGQKPKKRPAAPTTKKTKVPVSKRVKAQ